jgi:uncharacterized protein (TIGR02996 family)
VGGVTRHRPFLEAILAAPDDPLPRGLYLDWLGHAGQSDEREADRAARLAAWDDPRDRMARYYAVEYLFGEFGQETGHRPGDPIPQCWPPTPFARRWDWPREPWRAFFYCLFQGADEDAAGWLAVLEG